MPLLALTLLAAAAAATPFMGTPEEERIYQARFAEIVESGELRAYSPLEPVKGASGAGWLPKAAPGERTISEDALAAARDYAKASNASAFIVWRDGKVEEASYFSGATPASEVVSKSLAKPITAVAIGRALKLGKIRSLDQKVSDYIPEWKGTPKDGILIRHLLQMNTGLLAQSFTRDPMNIWSRAYLHPRHETIMVNEYPLTDPPGSRYEYNNVTSELVALVIERATKRRYAEFLGTEVFQPIGAMSGQVWIDRPGGLAHSGCCILLPAENWVRLAKLLLDDGVANGTRLLPDGYVAAMRTGTAQNPYYGMGVYVAGLYIQRRGFANPARKFPGTIHSEPYLAADTFLFDGNSNQAVWIVPSEKLIVLRVGASPPKAPEYDNVRLPNTVMRGIKRRPGETAPPPQPRPATPLPPA